MGSNFGSLVFTPMVKALQEKYGSRRQYARMEGSGAPGHLSPDESAFIAEQESFYLATVGASGWPYVQYRGGPKGFLKVIDNQTLAFADFQGNKQFITTGNLATDNRIALIIVDYPLQARLKLLGRVEVFEGEAGRDWIKQLRTEGYKAVISRAFVIRIEAFDWNCPQHIKRRFTEEQIQEAIAPFERRLQDLVKENQELRENKKQLKGE